MLSTTQVHVNFRLSWYLFLYYHKFTILSVSLRSIDYQFCVLTFESTKTKHWLIITVTTKVQTCFEIKNTSIISSKNTFLPKFRLRSGYINYTLEKSGSGPVNRIVVVIQSGSGPVSKIPIRSATNGYHSLADDPKSWMAIFTIAPPSPSPSYLWASR